MQIESVHIEREEDPSTWWQRIQTRNRKTQETHEFFDLCFQYDRVWLYDLGGENVIADYFTTEIESDLLRRLQNGIPI